MHGQGARRVCPTCGQKLHRVADTLSHRELRGPRNITSSNVDRIFDDAGGRFLVIEEKNPTEKLSRGQRMMLLALAKLPRFDIWVARGTPERLSLTDFGRNEPWPFLEDTDFDGYQAAVANWFARRAVSA